GPEGQGGPVNADLAGVEPVALPRLPLAEVVARRRRLETIDVHVLDTGRHDVLEDVHPGDPGETLDVRRGVVGEAAQVPVVSWVVPKVFVDLVEAALLGFPDLEQAACEVVRSVAAQRHTADLLEEGGPAGLAPALGPPVNPVEGERGRHEG